MEPRSPYRDLTLEQAVALREVLQDRYWNLMDALGSVAVEKALVTDVITGFMQGGSPDGV